MASCCSSLSSTQTSKDPALTLQESLQQEPVICLQGKVKQEPGQCLLTEVKQEPVLRLQEEGEQVPTVCLQGKVKQEPDMCLQFTTCLQEDRRSDTNLPHWKPRRNRQRKCSLTAAPGLQEKGQRDFVLNAQADGRQEVELGFQEKVVHESVLPMRTDGHRELGLHLHRASRKEPGLGVREMISQQHTEEVRKRRGRPSLEPDEAKRRRVQRQKERRKNTVNLGKSQQEWTTLKNLLSYKKDADFAAFLLNFYRKNSKGTENKPGSVPSSVTSPTTSSVSSSATTDTAIHSAGLVLRIKQEEDDSDEWKSQNSSARKGNMGIKKENGAKQAGDGAPKYKRKKTKVDNDDEKYMKLETTFTGSKTLFCLKSMKISRKSKLERIVNKSHY
ncbi:uncharacterized protein [Ambystoma mexicanum]|uniref:uncharacterized protein isoform X2 n=1 Tax=Ambystoma mexicanum TaxID=8296 RepID=UPI0037E8C0A6